MRSKQTHNRALQPLIWAASLLLLVPATPAAEKSRDARDVRPGYARSEAARPAAVKPAKRATMPDSLRRESPADTDDVAKANDAERRGAVATRPRGADARHPADRGPDRLTESARAAAVWAAEATLATRGRAEYYRAGFFLGQRDALSDRSLGEWDFREGLRFARQDPEARRAGLSQGEADAADMAWNEAENRVRTQFMNLGADPRFEPYAAIPAYAADRLPVPGPTLNEVFADFPFSGFGLAGGRPDYVAGFPIDAAMLRGCATPNDFFDRGWDDPGAAFRDWMANPGRSRSFRTLSDTEDRRRFRAVFEATFTRQLNRLGERALAPAFDRGFDDGFDYGAFVRQELDYRRGYFEGFNLALDRAAERRFQDAFPRSYESAYTSLFREWSDNPKPAIGEVRLVDASGDGVFEPGERVIVETELINYGGQAGRFPIRVEGGVLESGGASERARVVPARSVDWDRRLAARIRSDTANRTRTALSVTLADVSATVPLTVSFPLQFVPASLNASRRNLLGEVRVEIEVQNQSRFPRDGSIEVTASRTSGVLARAAIAELGAGRSITVSLTVRDLPVLDLIAGDVTLDLRATSAGTQQDSAVYRVPDVVRDLDNDDLLAYVVSLSRDPHASPREVERARSLFLLRLREDWVQAVRGFGNPYKADYRRDGTATALGELVQTVSSVPRGPAKVEVFGGLSGEVVTLARELPGAHPFLRKYMRRLARELP